VYWELDHALRLEPLPQVRPLGPLSLPLHATCCAAHTLSLLYFVLRTPWHVVRARSPPPPNNAHTLTHAHCGRNSNPSHLTRQLLVLADHVDQYRYEAEGTSAVNPGSFSSDGAFLVYYPR